MIQGVYAKDGETVELLTNGMTEIVPERTEGLDALFYFLPVKVRKRKSKLHKAMILLSLGAPLIAAETVSDAYGLQFFTPLFIAALVWSAIVLYANSERRFG